MLLLHDLLDSHGLSLLILLLIISSTVALHYYLESRRFKSMAATLIKHVPPLSYHFDVRLHSYQEQLGGASDE